MNTLMIVNPVSGAGSALKKLPHIKKCFEELGFKYDLVFTHSRNNGKIIAREASGKYKLLIAVGGDGTINEVINGVIASRKPAKVAIIPTGTGNAYASAISIPNNIKEICRKISKPKFKKVDVIHLRNPSIHAIACFGFGFDANVLALRNWMNIPGYVGYIPAFLWSVFHLIKYRVRLKMDHKTVKKKVLQVIVSNSPYYGYGLLLCPKAKVDDGMLDINTYNLNRLDLIRTMRGVPWRKLKKIRKMHSYKSKRLHIKVRHKIPVQYDGQFLKTKRKNFYLEIMPKAIEIVWFK